MRNSTGGLQARIAAHRDWIDSDATRDFDSVRGTGWIEERLEYRPPISLGGAGVRGGILAGARRGGGRRGEGAAVKPWNFPARQDVRRREAFDRRTSEGAPDTELASIAAKFHQNPRDIRTKKMRAERHRSKEAADGKRS